MPTIWNQEQFLKNYGIQEEKALKKSAAVLQRQIVENLSQPGPAGPPGGFPHVGYNANLRKNVGISDTYDNGNGQRAIKVGIKTGVPYALIQEYGGVIRPTKKQALTVPISEEAKKWSARGGSARTFPTPLEQVRRPNKPTFLIEKREGKGQKNKRWIIHYMLLKSVKIPARPYLRPSVPQVMPRIVEIFKEHLT